MEDWCGMEKLFLKSMQGSIWKSGERLLRDIDYPDHLELKQEWEGFEQKLFRKKRVFNWWVTVAAVVWLFVWVA